MQLGIYFVGSRLNRVKHALIKFGCRNDAYDYAVRPQCLHTSLTTSEQRQSQRVPLSVHGQVGLHAPSSSHSPSERGTKGPRRWGQSRSVHVSASAIALPHVQWAGSHSAVVSTSIPLPLPYPIGATLRADAPRCIRGGYSIAESRLVSASTWLWASGRSSVS